MALKREEFAATVGCQGATAVVDRKLVRVMKGLSVPEALEKGMFRQGFAAALYESEMKNDPASMEYALDFLGKEFRRPLSAEDAKRLLGIQRVPREITRTMKL